MNEQLPYNIEEHLRLASATLVYPPTPDIASQVRRRVSEEFKPSRVRTRRLAWGLALVAILLAGLLAVPGVRAQVLEFLQIGVVRIFLVEPSPTPTPPPPEATSPGETRAVPGALLPPPTALPTFRPTPTPLASVLDLAGETSLEQAEKTAGFPILIPTYPADLGLPDRIFLQNLDGKVLVLVWLDHNDPGKVRFSLQQFSDQDNLTVTKFEPVIVQETSVAGNRAAWTEGPYLLRLRNGDIDILRLIEGHVLIWEQDGITYRLETDLTLEEAVRVAESIQPWR